MRYFKVIRGYGQDDFIPIDETELEKALYAQIVGNITVTFESGSLIGNQISAIMPDYHRAMGWNYGHRMGPDDWNQMNRSAVPDLYRGIVGIAKERVNYFIKSNQLHLIGTGAEIPALSTGREDTRELAASKRI